MKKNFLAGGFRRSRWLVLVAVLGAVAFVDSSRAAFLDPGATGTKIRAQQPDRELRDLLRQIDQGNLENTVNKLVSFGTRHTSSSQTDPNRGIGAAISWVTSQMQTFAAASNGHMTVQQQSFVQPASSRIPVPTTITNVIATLQGSTNPERIYVVAAHLDSRVTDVFDLTDDAPGADDDASGVAAVMELARVLATAQPKATLVFSIVDGAEQGLFGSAFEAAQLKAAGADVEAMFSDDTVGSSTADDGTHDRHTLRLFAEGVPTAATSAQVSFLQAFGGEVDGVSRQLGRFVKSVADNSSTDMHIRIIYRRDRVLGGSDHISFLQQGYPAARFSEPHENYAHEHQNTQVVNGVQFGDLVEFLDFAYLERVAKVNLATMWSLSQAPGTPKNVQILVPGFTNDTDLTWTRGAEPDLAGYEVVWRETTDPDWTHVIPVGDVTSAHLPDFSKDNVFFGVRAVDSDGHASPVAFPSP